MVEMCVKKKSLLMLSLVVLLAASSYVGWRWLASDRILVAIDAPIVSKTIFDPSDMDAMRLYFEEHPNSLMEPREIYYDFNPANSARGFTDAMQNGVKFFVTTQPSSTLVASHELFDRSDALLINTSATSPLMTGKDDFILRIIGDGQQEQVAMADFIQTLPGKRLLIIQDAGNAAYTDPAYRYFAQRLRSLGKWDLTHAKFVIEKFQPNHYRKLMEQPFDALYILGGDFQSSIGNIAQLFYQYHPDAPIILTPWARSTAIFETSGKAIDNIILLSHHPEQAKNESIRDYLQRFEKRFGYKPMAMALQVRQGLELLEQTFAAGHTTPAAAKAYLLSQPEVMTSIGPVRFDATGDTKQTLYPIKDLRKELGNQ